MTRPSKEETWLNVAAEIARRATCLRRAVGCVLVDARGHVVGTGYNGRAAGLPHCNEDTVLTTGGWGYAHACAGATAPTGTNLDGCEAVHAEQNALLQCRDVYAIDTCYVTVSPCVTCVKLLLNTSCRRIVFAERYGTTQYVAASKLWRDAGRSWDHYTAPGKLNPDVAPNEGGT